MQVSVENISTLARKLTVTVPSEVVAQQYQERLAKLSREIRINGFRAGRVPKNVVEKRYSKAIHSEVVGDVINSSYMDAIAQQQLEPVGLPKIEEVKAEQGQDVHYVAVLEVYPEIIIKPFSEITVEKRSAVLKDSDVDRMIERLKKRYANYNVVDRASKATDKMKVDFVRTIDSKESDKHEDVTFDLASDGLFEDIKKGLIGRKAGDAFTLQVAFPEDWSDKEMAGKPFTLDITVKHIEEPTLLSDEELVKKLHGEELVSFEEFTTKLRANMEKELQNSIKTDLQERVLEKLVEANTFEVPDALVEQEKKAMLKEARQEMEHGKMPSFELSEMDEMAHRRVVLGLLLNAIIRSQDLTVDGRKVREEIEAVAKNFPGKEEQITSFYYGNKDLLTTIERSVLLSQAVERVVAEAKVTEKEVSFEELTAE